MPDYKSMYLKLFNSVTDVIEMLCEAQERTEEIYINSDEREEDIIKTLNLLKKKNNS